MAARRPAMRSRSARLSVMGALLVALLYTLSPRQPAAPAAASQQQQQQQHSTVRELAEEEPQEGASGQVLQAGRLPHRPKYSLPEDLRVQAIMNGSQQHGQVSKAGPLRADFWTADKRPWREAAFMRMVMRGEGRPGS